MVGSRRLASIPRLLPTPPLVQSGSRSGFLNYSRGHRLRMSRASLDAYRPLPQRLPSDTRPFYQPMRRLVPAKPCAPGLLGIGALEADHEFAATVCLAADAMLRLPSDPESRTRGSLLRPGRLGAARWALLRSRVARGTRSTTDGVGVEVMPRSPTGTGGGRQRLLQLRE